MTLLRTGCLIALLIAGCATRPQSPSPWSRCEKQLENGAVYADQLESQFLQQCDPVVTERIDHLTLYHFASVPNYDGLTIIATDGRLVRAFRWTDYAPPHVYFDTMTDADRALLTLRTHLR